MRAAAALIFAVLVLPWSRPAPTPEELVDAAEAASARGDYPAAVGLYEAAEPRAADPGRVTLGLAAAKYRLASAGSGASAATAEAEALFRCCVAPGDPRRVEALLGLGNCLLRRAGDRDAGAAREALDCYEQCLADPHATPELIADARHNRERARLVLVQAEAAAKSRPDAPHNPDDDKPPHPPDRPPPGGEPDPDPQTGRQKAGTAAARADQGQPAQETGDTSPGRGNLPPVPDAADAPPLSARDAREHLDQAARRIVEDNQKHRRGAARPAPAGVRDW